MAYVYTYKNKNKNPKTPPPRPLLSWKVTRKRQTLGFPGCAEKWPNQNKATLMRFQVEEGFFGPRGFWNPKAVVDSALPVV